jgi:hypothetical protein
MGSRQVSWLAGRGFSLAFPERERSSGFDLDFGSPLTVAGAAPALPDGSPASLLAPDLAIQRTVTTRFSSGAGAGVNWLKQKKSSGSGCLLTAGIRCRIRGSLADSHPSRKGQASRLHGLALDNKRAPQSHRGA